MQVTENKKSIVKEILRIIDTRTANTRELKYRIHRERDDTTKEKGRLRQQEQRKRKQVENTAEANHERQTRDKRLPENINIQT